MPQPIPKVSIGLPVYNAGTYLSQTLESLLTQTYTDFELIITDNASTDETETICRHFAKQDARIRYIRNKKNIGGLANFNKTFRLAQGKYFKWAASDDLCHPEFLEACVALLDENLKTAFAFPKSKIIDEEAHILPYDDEQKAYVSRCGRHFSYDLSSETAICTSSFVARFRAVLACDCIGTVVYGLFRTEALRQTSLHTVHGSDRLLLAEIALQGQIQRVDKILFCRRILSTSTWKRSRRSWAQAETGQYPDGLMWPPWQSLRNYYRAVHRSNLSLTQKAGCYRTIAGYSVRPESLKNLFIPSPSNYWGLDLKLSKSQ